MNGELIHLELIWITRSKFLLIDRNKLINS